MPAVPPPPRHVREDELVHVNFEALGSARKLAESVARESGFPQIAAAIAEARAVAAKRREVGA